MNRGDGSDEPALDPRCASPPGARRHRRGNPPRRSTVRAVAVGSRVRPSRGTPAAVRGSRRRACVRNPRGALTNGRSVSAADVRTLRPRPRRCPRPRLARRSVQSICPRFRPARLRLINTISDYQRAGPGATDGAGTGTPQSPRGTPRARAAPASASPAGATPHRTWTDARLADRSAGSSARARGRTNLTSRTAAPAPPRDASATGTVPSAPPPPPPPRGGERPARVRPGVRTRRGPQA